MLTPQEAKQVDLLSQAKQVVGTYRVPAKQVVGTYRVPAMTYADVG